MTVLPPGSGAETPTTTEDALDASLAALYQAKGAKKLTFPSGAVRFVVKTQKYVSGSADGIILLLDSDGTTILKTVTQNSTTNQILTT